MSHVLNINEIFVSVQGEGFLFGKRFIFVRLAGCNLQCPFCDTEHKTVNIKYSLDQLIGVLHEHNCQNVLWTGGEPLLQLTREMVHAVKAEGFYQAIETNGSLPVPDGINYVTISPKTETLDNLRRHNYTCNEVRVPVAAGDDLLKFAPVIYPKAENLYLSPIFDGKKFNEANFLRAVEIKRLYNDRWQISLQNQKLLNFL